MHYQRKQDGKPISGPARYRNANPIIDGWRVCSYCDINQPISNYYLNRNVKTGYLSRCKGCEKFYAAATSYGFSLETLKTAFEEQGGHCAICGSEENLHVDHCHTTGAFRAWLCHGCNTSLGGFGEDIDRLQRAIDYLREHGAIINGKIRKTT